MYDNAKSAAQASPSMTRQHWLECSLVELRRSFAKLGYDVPAKVRVSIGWPHGARGGKGGADTIGQCWYDSGSSDKHHEIFISPSQGDGARIIDILAHELCHVIAGPKAKHGAAFKAVAVAIGLTGKMTATVAGEPMKELAADIIRKHGKYPGGKLSALRKIGKQGTRLLKCECETCGYIARVTRKWIDDVGEPTCGVASHGRMVCD
jgi:hypothetical protein